MTSGRSSRSSNIAVYTWHVQALVTKEHMMWKASFRKLCSFMLLWSRSTADSLPTVRDKSVLPYASVQTGSNGHGLRLGF